MGPKYNSDYAKIPDPWIKLNLIAERTFEEHIKEHIKEHKFKQMFVYQRSFPFPVRNLKLCIV